MNRSIPCFFSIAAFAASVAGCGSDSGKSGCSTPEISGDLFLGNGTATVTGTGTLPDGIADGLEVGIMVTTGGASVGVLPENLFAPNDRVCGKTVRYTIGKVEAGTHTLSFDVPDPNSDSADSLYRGTDDTEFTIADGQTLTVNATFHMTPK